MCVAVVTTPGKIIAPTALDAGWKVNRDGAGMAYIKDGKVVIDKGYFNLDKFKEAYSNVAALYGVDNPMLVHMRIRTSGRTDRGNTHPFRIRGGALIHNGVLFSPSGPLAGEGESRNSDTFVLAATVHNIFTKNDVRAAKSDLEEIFSGNKIACLYDDGDYVILNEKVGFWNDGIWYSNSSCGVK